jgi:hypothetical protein
MLLSKAPVWGSFTFKYKGVDIYVPNFLNNVVRYKPISFWDWLIYIKNPGQTSVALVYEYIVEEEEYSSKKLNSTSTVQLAHQSCPILGAQQVVSRT